uniref:Integrin alpha FG-GAP repeat containing 2 n=1 Tax=Sinocyclocheilus rhinocerous TaxID=307959 RepID=A0A673IFE3_9TELE
MRSVSYVQRVSLDFTGTIFPHAICLGDADNDLLNELVVGDTSGKLYIYKNDDCKPWITRTCVGMVRMGDVCNKGRNFVVAVGAEGWFHLFDISAAAAKSDSSSQQDGSIGDEQKPSYTQHIPANTKVMLISDIDGDGRCELVVGYTDRVVRAFRWEEPSDASDLSSGQMVLLKKWLLDGQVDNLSVNPSPEGLPELMVSQPGCGYAILMCSWTQEGAAGPGDENTATPTCACPSRDVVLHLTTGRIHNKNVSTHLIGSICRGSKDDSSKGGLFALCTLDGDSEKLMDSSEKLLWSVQVDHQLFALQKLDVTCDGREEVVACAWDGQTYIIDHARMVVRFQFDENVNAFCAGELLLQSLSVFLSNHHQTSIKLWVCVFVHLTDISDTVAVRQLIGDVLYGNIAKDDRMNTTLHFCK